VYLVINIGHVQSIYNKSGNTVNLHAMIVNKYSIKKNSNILAPSIFIFNQIDKLTVQSFFGHSMQKCKTAEHCLDNEISFSTEALFTDCFNSGKAHIILDKVHLGALYFKPQLKHSYFGYLYVGIEGHYHIFQKTKAKIPLVSVTGIAQGN